MNYKTEQEETHEAQKAVFRVCLYLVGSIAIGFSTDASMGVGVFFISLGMMP
jgi:hypothetical protein